MSSSQASEAAAIAEQHYFQSNPPPKGLEEHTSLARDFVAQHAAAGRRVVLVSSGGTTVPLGKQTFVPEDVVTP
jgi:phosphopantothenate-cysteine ligase